MGSPVNTRIDPLERRDPALLSGASASATDDEGRRPVELAPADAAAVRGLLA